MMAGEEILHHLMKEPYTIPINQLKYNVKINEISQGYNEGFPFMLKAQALVHSTRCFGYRFEFENKVITYCTDTGPCPSINDLANNANLLIAECSLRSGQINYKWASNPHTSPMDTALVAQNSNVGQLALIHFDADNYTILEQRKEAIKEAENIFRMLFLLRMKWFLRFKMFISYIKSQVYIILSFPIDIVYHLKSVPVFLTLYIQ